MTRRRENPCCYLCSRSSNTALIISESLRCEQFFLNLQPNYLLSLLNVQKGFVPARLNEHVRNALPERTQRFSLYLKRGHDVELNILALIELCWLKREGDQVGVVLNQCPPRRGKIVDLSAGDEQATCHVATAHNRMASRTAFSLDPARRIRILLILGILNGDGMACRHDGASQRLRAKQQGSAVPVPNSRVAYPYPAYLVESVPGVFLCYTYSAQR